ncbi:hypothetical protein W97_02096 [Coniosporium apollinis CBS 100218]|uniref:Uncharacterized protein n=1 Tax=Coniosporium apollinis (strain CBS 100218) TaxID=1168221 RepID=R7YMI6_CONA1|nr:uncharacterized protein W97_02096 [Coniosporium apollinis CBS 100218]EON62871.1 hypothetical protein W97_02096 [Coniosporium apollinis CBS 100218]
MWAQLRLRTWVAPEHTGLDGLGSSKGLISIKLDHDRLEDVPQKNVHHQLSLGGSFADVKPPEGVEQIALEAINLKIRVTKTKPPRKKRRLCVSADSLSGLYNSQEDAWFESLEEAASQSSLYEDDILLLEGPLLCTSPSDELLWEEERQPTDGPGHVDAANVLPSSKWTTAALNPEDEVDEEHEDSVSPDKLTQLVDAALRLTIRERATKLPPGLKVKRTDLVARLSEFAPALWSPGYLPAVSQRAVFIPTIAHALSNSLYKNARSASLRSKIETLATKYTDPAEGNSSTEDTIFHVTAPLSASGAYDTISTKLWQLLQREIFDEKAARRLKPLKVPEDAVAMARQDGDDLLEDLTAANRRDDLLAFAAENELLDWADDSLDDYPSDDDLLFDPEPDELEEPEDLEDPESLWNSMPAWPPDQGADDSAEGLLMPVPRRPARLSFTDSGFGQRISPSSESRSGADSYLEPFVEMHEIDIEQGRGWTQDGTSDGDIIMSF